MPKPPRIMANGKPRRPGSGGMIDDVNEAMTEEQVRLERYAKILKAPYRTLGRPTNYDDDMPRRAWELLTDHRVVMTKKLCADHLGVSYDAFNEWENKYEAFRHAVAQGLHFQEAIFATLMANGMKYSQSLTMVLKNLHHWTDRNEETHVVDYKDEINKALNAAKRVNWDAPYIDGQVIEPPALASGENNVS